MPKPKIPADRIAEIKQLMDDYATAHEVGGYRPGAIAMRRGYNDRFIDYLEGRYNPATDKGKRIVS